MENKFKVYPVMLSTNSYNGLGSLIVWRDVGIIQMIKENSSCLHSEFNNTSEWIPQHLYLVSDKEIKKGDYYWNSITGKGYKNADNGTYDKIFKKIEYTTDPSLGLPLIPQSFVEEYVQKQGKIEYVYIDMSQFGTPWLKGNNHEIIILPTKDSYDRDEVFDVLNAYRERLMTEETNSLLFEDLVEWFDKNY